MRYWLMALLMTLCFGCDSGTGSEGGGDVVGGEDTNVGGDEVSGDTTPPEFRAVQVDIYAEPKIPLDLNTKDVERVLPKAFPATFTVFTTDDESATEEIIVTVLLGDGLTPVEGQTAAFNAGLWTVDVPSVGPGQAFKVQVEDEAGNALIWEFSLTIPTLEQAIVGDWSTRWYSAEGVHSHSWEATWTEDGAWTESQTQPELELEGTWSLDGDTITVDMVKSVPGDEDPETVDRRDESEFYVDETYFATWPLTRVGEGDGLEGTWTRAVKVWTDHGDGLVLDEDEVHTLDFAEGGVFTLTLEGVIDGEADQSQVFIGTWVRVPNENYIENYGDYLVLTLESRDGVTLDEPVSWVDLMVIRHELLLLSPKVRAY